MDNLERKRLGLPYRYDDPALLGDQRVSAKRPSAFLCDQSHEAA